MVEIRCRIGDMNVGERLREMREQAGLSLGQVGAYEGVTPQYLSQLEKGVRAPNVWPLLARLARRYKTSADYLLGLSDDPRPPAGAAEDAVSRQDDTRIAVDSLERLADRVGNEFVDELIEFLRFAPEPDIDALTAFVRALKEIEQRRQKV
jgi:transcriptional regulator with XRE-family HTH domain